jgi:hypothetical protein
MSAAWSKIHEDLNTSSFYQRVQQRAPIWQRLQKGGMFLAVTALSVCYGAANSLLVCAYSVQVPISSVNSSAADLETHVMRQSPRVSNQLVTLNARTVNVCDSTLTPAMVPRGGALACTVQLTQRAGLRVARARQHSVRGKRLLWRQQHHVLHCSVDRQVQFGGGAGVCRVRL